MTTRDHAALLARLHPRGLWSTDADAATAQELEAWGQVLDSQDGQVDDLLLECLPDAPDALLSRFEALYDLHRETGLTVLQRQRRLIARVRYLPNCRPATLESVLEQYSGLTITVVEPFAFRCDDPDSLTDTASDVIDGGLCWWVEVDEVAARASDISRIELEEEIDRIKPAHTVAFVRCDDFACDDEWSLTDRDLLGA